MQLPNPIAWTSTGEIRLLDQTLLPAEERYLTLDSVDSVAEAIKALRVRGAPLIGIAAAMGVALAARRGREDVRAAITTLGATRPTSRGRRTVPP
jgi:methylthioribose-1-phosphate isomerase